jgi:hypothetical protein
MRAARLVEFMPVALIDDQALEIRDHKIKGYPDFMYTLNPREFRVLF